MADGFDLDPSMFSLGGEGGGSVLSPGAYSLAGDVMGGGTPGGFSLADATAPSRGFSLGGDTSGFSVPSAYSFANQLPMDAPQAGGGFNWGNVPRDVGRSLTTDPLGSVAKIAGIGTGALGIANQLSAAKGVQQAQQVQTGAMKRAETAAAPAVSMGQQLTQATQAGQLPAAQTTALEQWKERAKADMRAKLAHLGISDSTTMNQYMQAIDMQAEEMKGKLLQSQGALGLEALQTGVSAATGGAQIAGQQMQVLNNLITQANQSLGLMTGRQA